MQLTSTCFIPGGALAQRYGKRSENISPQLSWDDVPHGTRAFALSFVDVHPVARGYVHWLLTDIDGRVRELPEGAASGRLPPGARELVPYAGPFPPSGTHEYVFTVYALSDEHVPVRGRPGAEELARALAPATLATATLSCLFTRV